MTNLIVTLPHVPPGFFDKSVEFVVKGTEVFCQHDGQRFEFNDIPNWILEIVKADMHNNTSALKSLIAWDITDETEQVKQYICCRFGAYDHTPDIDVNGKISPAEYIQCGRHGNCDYETKHGKLCVSIVLSNGILSKREIEVLALIGQGKQDKEICYILGIKQPTLNNHKNSIEVKSGVQGKVAMGILAHRYQLS